MKKIFLICASLLLVSCKDSNTPPVDKVSMNLYGRDNKLLVEDYQQVETISKGSYDSVITYNKGKIMLNYNMKINSTGIFKSCDSKFLKTHSFDTIAIENNTCIEPGDRNKNK